MPKEQKNHKPSVLETKVDKTKESTVEETTKEISEENVKETPEEVSLPDIKDLNSILEKSEKVASIASLSEEEIDEKIKSRQEILDQYHDLELFQEQRLRRLEKYNPLKDLTLADYNRLLQEKVIDEEFTSRYKSTPEQYINFLKEMDSVVAKLESLKNPSTDAVAELERLSQIRISIRENLESQIEEKQQDLSEHLEKIKNRMFDNYAKRVEKMEKAFEEIVEGNPRIGERLEAMARNEMKEKEEEIEQERKKLLAETSRLVQSLGAKNNNAFKRLAEITNNEDISQFLIEALEEEDPRKQQGSFDRERSHLIKSIIEGEDEQQLKDSKEVVPWEVYPTSIRYIDAIKTLQYGNFPKALRVMAKNGDEQAKRLLEQTKQIITENEALRKLLGKRLITDKKTNEKHLGTFWSAFEIRKANDESGLTKARKKEREEAKKKEQEFQKISAEIIKRGGFPVKIPIKEKSKRGQGRPKTIGSKKGVVRLEKVKSKKGENEYHWKVVEFTGATNELGVGTTSPLDMRSFPEWLSRSAENYFIKDGENFVERFVDEPNE